MLIILLINPNHQPNNQTSISSTSTTTSQTNYKSHNRMAAKGPKLSFPEFDGADPEGWIRKAEMYSELEGVSNEEGCFWHSSTAASTAVLVRDADFPGSTQ
jgi:hypothetical protein